MNTQLYFGTVMHDRLKPSRHRFRHGVFFLRVNLREIDRMAGPLFSIDRWNVFSFHRADHGPRDGSELEPWMRALLARHGIDCADGDVVLQTFPRVLGYVFNPVSFWLAYDRGGGLRAVLAEVSNTFGERHNYLVTHADGRRISGEQWLEATKVFHVSPFFGVAGRYRFRFTERANGTVARIDYYGDEGLLLRTAIGGEAAPFDTRRLGYAFMRYPGFTLGVIARIHWHALRLWLKRVPFFPKPLPPAEETTK
jgi:DUF1365 family protein